jgi:hypothetical protein
VTGSPPGSLTFNAVGEETFDLLLNLVLVTTEVTQVDRDVVQCFLHGTGVPFGVACLEAKVELDDVAVRGERFTVVG